MTLLDMKHIESFYPEYLRPFKRNILREYLQYKILESLYSSDLGRSLVFMGGTAIHILHGNPRFSEDLDFDNKGLSERAFEKLTASIQRELTLQGYDTEIKHVFKGAYSCSIKIRNILCQYGLIGQREENLLVKIDAEPQPFSYVHEMPVINKFDVFTKLYAVPVDILLAQKITALFKRKRLMGRDIFDIVYLYGMTSPDYAYVQAALDINSQDALQKRLIDLCATADFKQLAQDVEPFLYRPADANKILLFPDFVRSME